jgi:hypothetical protein
MAAAAQRSKPCWRVCVRMFTCAPVKLGVNGGSCSVSVPGTPGGSKNIPCSFCNIHKTTSQTPGPRSGRSKRRRRQSAGGQRRRLVPLSSVGGLGRIVEHRASALTATEAPAQAATTRCPQRSPLCCAAAGTVLQRAVLGLCAFMGSAGNT